MRKPYALLMTLLFCLFFGGGFLAHLLTPDRVKSEVENRNLQQTPAFSVKAVVDGSFMEETEDYIADQFPLRDDWTTVRARAEQLMGKREFHGVYLCGDQLISKVEPSERGEDNLRYVKALGDKTDIPVYLGLIPSAAEVWKDALPPGATSFDQAAYIAHAAEVTGLPQIDYLSALSAHSDQDLYYRTDHHWTSLGAYYGYAAVAKAFGFTEKPLDAFTPERVTEDFNGTLYSTSGVHWLPPDPMDLYVPADGLTVTSWRTGKPEAGELYDRSWLEKKDKYSLFLGGNQPLCVVSNPEAAGGKVLMVRDSYADSLAPFLATEFQEVHLLDLRYYKNSVARYAEENGMDAIVVSYSVPNFLSDANLVFLGK